MALPTPAMDYRSFRLKKINEPQYRHLWWLLFFPVYWLRYPLIENWNPAAFYHPIYCPLDDVIPFCEWFILPYMLWMVTMVSMALYTVLYDVDTFQWYMKFLTVSMSVSTVVFLIYPSCQNLRPAEFPRENLLTECCRLLYRADTNTNVFPSEHVIGSIAVWLAALRTQKFRAPVQISVISILMPLIAFSTVFLKQHSILDVAAALPVCVITWFACNARRGKQR